MRSMHALQREMHDQRRLPAGVGGLRRPARLQAAGLIRAVAARRFMKQACFAAQAMVRPPSTTSVWPVTNDAASEAR